MRQRGAIEILEEALHLLREAPAATLALYLAGAVPFLAGLLLFLTDMTRSPFAAERLAAESLGVALLFLWKSVWEAIFQARLYRQLSLTAARPSKLARLVAIQCALQPFSLPVIFVSSLAVIPFGWTVAFFRNAGLFAALGEPEVIAASRRQARLWTRQNWILLSLITLAGLLLFANVLISIVLLPQAGRSIFGVEGEFARLGAGLLNATTLGVAACATWLLIDPLLDAVYVLRCFYGESIATGDDLRVTLKKAIGIAAMMVMLLVAIPNASGQSGPPLNRQDNARSTLDAQRLDRAIGEVIRRPEFAWRASRSEGPEPHGRWVGWVRSALDTLSRAARWLMEHIRNLFRNKPDDRTGDESATQRPPIEIWIAMVAIALLAAGIAAFIAARRKRIVQARPVQTAARPVDLADESVTADQLPESSWLQLAEELLANGDCRLALRALYLAGLTFLSERNLISIQRWKSGRDYRRELDRRARGAMEANLTPAFARNVFLFERGWYGKETVERADVQAFAMGLEEIRRYASRA